MRLGRASCLKEEGTQSSTGQGAPGGTKARQGQSRASGHAAAVLALERWGQVHRPLQTELKASLGYTKVPKRRQRPRVVRERRALIGSHRRPTWLLLADQGRWVPGSRG